MAQAGLPPTLSQMYITIVNEENKIITITKEDKMITITKLSHGLTAESEQHFR